MNIRSFEARQPIYKELYKTIRPTDAAYEQWPWCLKKITFNQKVYEEVGLKTGVPWFFVAILHGKEASFDLKKCVHNGDDWTKPTVHVPKGRGPFSSWSESTIDALLYDGLLIYKNWSVERMLWCAEKFNGWGYVSKGINSPYLWSSSNHYSKGLYVSDGIYDEDAKQTDIGAATMMCLLEQQGFIKLKYEDDFKEKKPEESKPVEPVKSVELQDQDKQKEVQKVSFLTRLMSFFKSLFN